MSKYWEERRKKEQMEKEKLTCIKCRKIIVEVEASTSAKVMNKLKDILGNQKYINCPYCGYIYLNPLNHDL